MQMHDPKASSTRSSSTLSGASSAVKSGYNNSGSGQVTSSGNKAIGGAGAGVGGSGGHNSSSASGTNSNSSGTKASDHNHQKRGKKKSARDRQQQPSKDEKNASAMSNLSSYSLIDDDHIDDQETINVGNLIIDLESDLEKEKIENEQANNNILENSSATNAPSSTSQLATPAASSSSSTTSTLATANKTSTVNKSAQNQYDQVGKSTNKLANNQKSSIKKESVTNSTANSCNLNNNGHNVSSRTVFKSSADERGELKMKITRETKPGKNEHKIVTSPHNKSPTSSSGGCDLDNGLGVGGFEHGCKPTQGSSGISSTREFGTSTSIGTITEPECLGPCEPGTSVTLEGIVWQETDGGILVVNVTWRGKTYVGALLDCTRHDWAPPRLCDSPASDIDAKTSKGVRGKRIVTRSNGTGLDEKNLLQTTGKLRNGKGRRIPRPNEPASCNKRQRDASDKPSGESSNAQNETGAQQAENMASTNSETTCIPGEMDPSRSSTSNNNQLESSQEPGNNLLDKSGPESPALIGCNEPNCNKKYRNMNGLLYHQSHAHSAENESPPNDQDDCTSSSKDKSTKSIEENAAPDDRLSPRQAIMQSNSPSDPMVRDEKPADATQHYGPNRHGQKRERSPSPEGPQKLSNSFATDPMHYNMTEHRPRLNDSPRITAVRNVNQERRNSSSPSQIGNVPRGPDHGLKPPGANQKHHPYDPQIHGSSSSSAGGNPQMTTQSSSSSKSSSHGAKPSSNPQPPLPAPTEEGMKPSGTSTGPPPAPHQANCYFNPAFLAQTFNPYAVAPYFPRHMYDPLSTQSNIPTSNAAFLTRFMNNMRAPPPSDSPSRLLSPSTMPKNIPYPPFKPDGGALPPQIPTSHPMPNLSPMTNPQMPPMPVPPLPPLSMANIPPNLRMPSPSDVIMPPSSQPLPFPGLNPMLGLPGMPGNPLRGPLGGPPVPNLVDDPLSKHLPRRF